MGNKCFKDNADSDVIYGMDANSYLEEDGPMCNTPTNQSMTNKQQKQLREIETDKPHPTMVGKNAYERIEYGNPMARTDIRALEIRVNQAHRKCGNLGFVTLEALQA